MNSRRDEPATKKDLDQVKQELTDKIDTNSVKIDNLTIQVINNREEIKKIVTRTEFNKRSDEIMRNLDALMAVFTRVDQEQAATTARIDRIESDVERLKAR